MEIGIGDAATRYAMQQAACEMVRRCAISRKICVQAQANLLGRCWDAVVLESLKYRTQGDFHAFRDVLGFGEHIFSDHKFFIEIVRGVGQQQATIGLELEFTLTVECY